MNSNQGMFGQQQQQVLPSALQQQVLMQQLQQQQLVQQQQQQLQQSAAFQAPAASAVPNYGAAVAQMQARLVSQQAAAGQGQQSVTGLPPGMHMQPGSAAVAAAAAAPASLQIPAAAGLLGMPTAGLPPVLQPPAAATVGQQQAAAVQPTPAAAMPANAPKPLPPVAPTPAAAAAAGPNAGAPAAAGAAAAAAGAADAADPRFEKVGFAKLLGDGLEFYITKYEIVLGRKSKSAVDVVLGDSAVLSRQHCRIVYNFQAKKWQLAVEGKNGVTVNGTVHTPASGPCNLASQDLLQAGDMSFYFLLPKPIRKPKAKPAATAAGAAAADTPTAAAGASGGGASAPQQQQQQQQGQSVPGTPVLGAGSSAAAGASPRLPGFSPGLPQAGALLPGLSAAAAGPGGPGGLQHFSSGPMLAGLGVAGGGVFPGFQGAGLSGVQGYPGGANLAGSQDLLQPGLGGNLDEGMMDV